ncbi:histidine phosphatase family protein, partial [Candidatus Sumerlaeota bacterium]|nr:histidine phosphatase family protein [Candidatus Sumerlaeota bacterium]
MKPPLRLYLIRHGETDYNLKRVIQGHGEVPLNTTGKKQAARLGERLRAEGIELIYSSDVRRAAMTAEILASHIGAPIEFDALWRERNPGDLIHKPYDEAGAFFSDPDYAPKGGEGVAEFDARIRAAAENLLKKEKARMARKAGARDAERTGAQRVAVV